MSFASTSSCDKVATSFANADFSVSHTSTNFSSLSSKPWFTRCTLLWASYNLQNFYIDMLIASDYINYTNLLYFSWHVNNSSFIATTFPFGNSLASFKKLVSIVTIWVSRSTNLCFKFSISTCKCTSWSFATHLEQTHPHS